jgi:hypothetical protein
VQGELTHAATHLHARHGVPGWHCQMITVAYERTRGLRASNQSCTGGFQVSVSKAVTVMADKTDLPDAATVEDRRARWRAALQGLSAHLSRSER